MYSCRAVPFDWAHTHLIIVSGSGPNLCGHAVVNAGQHYFHIDGLNEYPWHFSEPGYRRYLLENQKRELRRVPVKLTDIEGAQRKMEELSARRWRWLVLPHNCATYAEEIFAAGGVPYTTTFNCPVGGWN